MNRRLARLALLATVALLTAGPANAIVDRVRFCSRNFGNQERVPLEAGRNVIEVFGGLVDTATRVEVSGLTGVVARISHRTGGVGSNVAIEIDVPNNPTDGDEGEIRLRYAVELAGFDKVRVRLVAPARITSFEVQGVQPENGRFHLQPGVAITLVARGTNLDDLGLSSIWSSFGSASFLSRTNTEARVRFTPRSGNLRFDVGKVHFSNHPFCAGNVEGTFSATLIVGDPSSGGGFVGRPLTSTTGGGAAPPAPAQPDLVPTRSGFLLRPGPNRQVATSLCTNLPSPPRPDQAATGTVTVPPFQWGVINSSNGATGSGFTVRLSTGAGAALATETVPALAAGGQRLFTLARTQNQTKVIRIDALTNATTKAQYGGPSANGCFQLIMPAGDPLNWSDPASLKVRVDVTNAVAEGSGGEINNEISF